MILDAVTVRNLELLEPLFAGERKDSTLVSVLDLNCDGHGRASAAAPPAAPKPRPLPKSKPGSTRVAQFLSNAIERTELRKTLGSILDLERLLAKVTLGTATPREMLALGRSLAVVPAASSCLRR